MTTPLNEAQRAFCSSSSENIRLLAPAGCGKTLSILHRCVHLVRESSQGIMRLLVVAFTRAAKDELQSRINEDDQFKGLRDVTDVATLNSWGFRRIKKEAFNPKLITSKKDYHFTVLNQLQPVWSEHSRIKKAIVDKKNRTPQVLMNVIDAFKSLGFDHIHHTNFELFCSHIDYLDGLNLKWRLDEQFDELTKLGMLESKSTGGGMEAPKAGRQEVYKVFFQFWREAAEYLIKMNTFTLEDQKYFAYLDEQQKLKEEKLLSGVARYSHLFVDEFQDINPLDLNLIKAIMQRNRATLTVAGDDDQAIFEWRGASIEYVLNPGKFFETSFDTHILDVNYRSPANIVTHSTYLIENNRRRVEKAVGAFSKQDASIDVRRVPSLSDALAYVYEVVEDSRSKGVSPAQVAIIGRKRSQIIPYQIYFASRDVPFCAAEDLSLFLSDAFDRLLDLIAIKTRFDKQDGAQIVGDVIKLCDLSKRYPLSKKDRENVRGHIQSNRPSSVDNAIDLLAGYHGSLKGANAGRRVSLAMAEAVRSFVQAKTVAETMETLSECFEGLQVDIGKAKEDIFYTDPPFWQLAEFASSYSSNYEKFVDDIRRAKDQLVYVAPFSDEEKSVSENKIWKRPVHLMTALRAKGKEFNTVILLDVIDGIWPNKNAKTSLQLEAERRVFYVAFTRARERVVMLFSDRVGKEKSLASPYIKELGLDTGSIH